MRLSHLLLVLSVAAALGVSSALFVWSAMHAPPTPVARVSVPYLFFVNDTSGFDLGDDVFRLGAVTPGGGAYRTLSLSHPDAAAATIVFRGEGREYLSAEPPVAVLSNGTVNFTIRAKIPLDAAYGRYAGDIRVLFYAESPVIN